MTFPFLSCAKSISSNIQTSDRIGGVPARDFPKCFRGWVLSVTGFVNQKLHPGWRRCWLSQSVEMVQHFPPENIHSFLYRCFCSCYWQLFPLNIYRHTTYTLSPHKYLNYSNIEVEGRRRQWLALNLHSIPCIWLVHIFDHSLFFSNSAAIGTGIMRPPTWWHENYVGQCAADRNVDGFKEWVGEEMLSKRLPKTQAPTHSALALLFLKDNN